MGRKVFEQTLIFVIRDNNYVLLAKRKHRFATDKLNGYGGWVRKDNGETPKENAIRKLFDESTLKVESDDVIYMGFVLYEYPLCDFKVHIFKTSKYEGKPTDSDKMVQHDWFHKDRIDFNNCIPNSMYWMLAIFKDVPFKCVVKYEAVIVNHPIVEPLPNFPLKSP